MNDELPPGWALATVGDVAHFVRGVTYSKEHARGSAASGFVPVLRATNIGDGLNYEDLVFVPDRFVADEQIVKNGDVVLAMSSGSKSVVGKAAVAKSPPRCGFGAFCGVIRPSEAIDHSLLGYYFQTKAYRNAISDVSKGSNINNLKADHVLCRPLPVPPKAEQARIASRIDELFSRIDEGERALERVQKLVERYRQSVLKAAVTGELTRDWRQKNKDKLESGEALLTRILKTRREAWEKAELEKMKAKGITPANDKWKQKYQVPVGPRIDDLSELPEGWIWASVDQVGFVSGGLTKNPKRGEHQSKRPYLRVANVYTNRLELDEVHQIGVAEPELDRVLLQSGDLLVVEGNGSIDQIGRVALWDGSIDGCVHQNHLIKLRCTSELRSWYILIWCMSPLGRSYIRRVASSTAGLHTLSISKIQALPVPIPNAGELETIKDRFEQMDSLLAKQRLTIIHELRRNVALKQAVLRAAFSGDLVTQDRSDEPAQAILERIAAERSHSSAKPKRGRKTKNQESA